MEADGDQVSPTSSLFCRSALTTIINLRLFRIPSDCILALLTYMHGVTGLSFSGSSSIKFRLLIKLSIYFRVTFRQGFFMSSDNFVTSEKFLGSGMKWETSEPDSPKGGNSCKISFTTVLNTLCKPLPMFHGAFKAPFHYDCLCLKQSHILKWSSLQLTFG